ncbi:hypothetical protein [Desulforegula conservatrix]|uniref:hypothetical protein n=1 Tax=Desulforegula conservatrix TaxID=153026 RepID=UPI0012EB396F|nr:hypothetical protein [Desulforegula conservatrix]
MEIAGGLNDRESGLVLLEEIASELRRLNNDIARGYGFRFLAEAAGKMGSGEKVAAYIHEACKSGDLTNDICFKPILPEAAIFLIRDDRSLEDYFSKSLSYVKSNSYGFDRACCLGNLAKTAALAFDKWTSLNYMNQFKAEFFAQMDGVSKQTLIEKMAEAACMLPDREFALSFLKSLYEDVQTINPQWPRSMAYQAIAGAAHLLGDDRASFSDFIFAAEAALQNETPRKIGWNISNFLLDKAEEIGFNLKKYDLMAKLDVAASQVEIDNKCGNAGEDQFLVYMHFARIAERIGEKEKGRQYLSKAKRILVGITLPNSMHNDVLDMAITAKNLGELALASDLGMKAFDMAKLESQKSPLRFLCISTVAGVARLYTGIGDIRYACSLAESEGFTAEDKAEIMCSVMAEYSKNQYRRIKSE